MYISSGPDARPDGYAITYTVREPRRLNGGVSTLVGTNDGSLVSLALVHLSTFKSHHFPFGRRMHAFSDIWEHLVNTSQNDFSRIHNAKLSF